MQLIQFLYIPIVAIALSLSGNANSVIDLTLYNLTKVVSVDGKKIVLKDLGTLNDTLFTRSGLRSSPTMLCSDNTTQRLIIVSTNFSRKRILHEDFKPDCEFIKLDWESKNDEPVSGFLTYLTSLFNVKDVKTDPTATRLYEHPTVSSGDYAVYVRVYSHYGAWTDTMETELIIIDTSQSDYLKTMLDFDRDNWSFDSSILPPPPISTVGWYTGLTAVANDVDHVVSLEDAYVSGGNSWSSDEKRTFTNDSSNHVTALPYITEHMKHSGTPLGFIREMNRVIRSDFASGKCLEYVDLYVQIKEKYKLNFINNRIDLAKSACH